MQSQILMQRLEQVPLFQIYESYDRHNWDDADTIYRKPSYQRTQSRDKEWCKGIIDSILRNNSIGAFHFSEWTNTSGTFYNIEDGQTRLDAVMRFVEGTVESSFGHFDLLNPQMRRRFENYQVCIILQRKRNNSITDEEYFSALNKNFTLLQDGKSLTSSDSFACQFPDPAANFAGAQLVLYTIDIVNNIFHNFFNTVLDVQMSNRIERSRKKIDDMISIVSGAIHGCDYATGGYRSKVEILFNTVTDEEMALGIWRMRTIINTIMTALDEYPRQPRERLFSMFGKPKQFWGSMLCDLEGNPDQDIQSFQQLWKNFINESRRRHNTGQKNWIENNVYNTLSTANRRNTSRIDYLRRMQCVHVFHVRSNAPENVINTELNTEDQPTRVRLQRVQIGVP